MSNKILFVFEGENTEKQIIVNLTKYFINEQSSVHCAYCADIYQLYSKIAEDQDLDTFVLLKERNQNRDVLSKFTREDFAEIYLFFDYDGHAINASDDKIRDLLKMFDQETEAGKLYISFPMVEALKHISEHKEFKNLKVKAKEKINYKKLVSDECLAKLKNLTLFTNEIWIDLIKCHLMKMNFIVNDNFIMPSIIIEQPTIFENQKAKYIDIDSTVAVLSAFPIFLLDYYGVQKMKSMVDSPID